LVITGRLEVVAAIPGNGDLLGSIAISFWL
jgi:hypothetical protein